MSVSDKKIMKLFSQNCSSGYYQNLSNVYVQSANAIHIFVFNGAIWNESSLSRPFYLANAQWICSNIASLHFLANLEKLQDRGPNLALNYV